MGVAILRAVGIVARRLGGGIMYYRMQSHTRRGVTRQYLSLPMEWHQRHPTGQLLSNAYSDVEAAWSPIMPLPMALGTVVMMVIAVVQMFVADVVMAVVGLLVFPAVVVANLLYQRYASPLMTRAQGLRAEVSEIAHESFDGAMVVKTLGREVEETDRFRAKAHELRDVNIRAGRIRAVFDPTLASLPSLGVLVVLAVGVARVSSGATERRRRGDRRLPPDHRLLPDPRDRLAARRVPALASSATAVPRRSSTRPATCPTATTSCRARRRARCLEVDGPPLLLRRRRAAAARRRLRRRARAHRRAGRRDGVRQEHADQPDDPARRPRRRPDPHRRSRPQGPRARARCRATSRWCRRPPSCSTTPSAATSRSAPTSPTSDVWAALRTAQADGFVAALPDGLDTKLGERGTSLSGGQRQRLSLARALVRRPRLLILDDATSAVDPEVEARILASLRDDRRDEPAASLVVVAYRKATISLADEVIHLENGRIVGRGTHAELLGRSPAYAHLVNAYEATPPTRSTPTTPMSDR